MVYLYKKQRVQALNVLTIVVEANKRQKPAKMKVKAKSSDKEFSTIEVTALGRSRDRKQDHVCAADRHGVDLEVVAPHL